MITSFRPSPSRSANDGEPIASPGSTTGQPGIISGLVSFGSASAIAACAGNVDGAAAAFAGAGEPLLPGLHPSPGVPCKLMPLDAAVADAR